MTHSYSPSLNSLPIRYISKGLTFSDIIFSSVRMLIKVEHICQYLFMSLLGRTLGQILMMKESYSVQVLSVKKTVNKKVTNQ